MRSNSALIKTIWCFLFSAKQIKTPKFDGSGYLSFTMPETKSIRHITSFSLELKTTSIDGMILWIGQDLSSDDYLGVGIRKGMVHLVWNLGEWPKHSVSLCVLLQMAFWYQNCSDLRGDKIVLVIEKNFWNLRLKAENVQKRWDHLNNLFKRWKVRTISGNRMLF